MSDHDPTAPPPLADELRIRRSPARARYDRETVEAIVDAAIVAHVGTVRDGAPVVVPMLAVRDGDWLLLHGAHAAGTLRRGRGTQVCVEMTLLDGLVLARSAFHHSLNYRSVVILGEAEVITDPGERERALELFVERLVPGRWAELRPSTEAELKQTAVVRISLERSSAKVRSGPPTDEEADYEWPVWAGIVPAALALSEPQPDPRLRDGIEVPEAVRALAGTSR